MMRKPQTKLAQGVKIFLLAVFILSTFNSCKKDQAENKLSDAQQIQKAKEWYQAQQKKQVTKLAVAVGKESEMIFTPDWDNAKVTYINGVASVSTDIKTNLQSKFGIERYFALVVKNDDNGFDYRILNIHSNGQAKDNEVLNSVQLYQTAFTDVDLSTQQPINADIRVHGNKFKLQTNISYNNSGKTLLALKKPNTGIKVEAEQCYDAYMVTYVYENGILVDVYQEYLGFEICHPLQQYFDPEHPSSGSGGGEMGSNEMNITWGDFDYSNESITTETATIDDDVTLVKHVSAYVYNAGSTARFKTYEMITLGKTISFLSNWAFRSIVHGSMTVEGTLIDMDVEPIVNYTQGTVHNEVMSSSLYYSNSYAKMEYSFKDKRTKEVNGKTIIKYSKDITGARIWGFAELGIPPKK